MKKSSKPIIKHIPDFLDWLDIEKGLSSRSQENYSHFLKRFVGWLEHENLSEMKPHELSPDDIWKYRVFLSRQVLSPASKNPLKRTTQNYYLIALRSLLNFFADRDIASISSEKIKLGRDKGERRVRFLTLEQLQKLFSAPNEKTTIGLRDRAILEIFFSTGMRISELVALNREQITIRKDIKDFELGITGKGERPRTVYFSQRALAALGVYLETREDNEKALFINYRTRARSPRRLTARSIEHMIKKYALFTGLPVNTTPHVMRHSFATDLLSQGVDIRTIQEFLGHKSIAATQVYAHVTSKKLRDIHRTFHGGGSKTLVIRDNQAG